jgi:uncharacterized delta-60 repeat protein
MLALALTAALALSTPGTLDHSFGGDGRVVTRTPDVPAVAGVESLPHGRTLLAGTVGKRTLLLIRYRRDGSIAKRRSLAFDRDVTATDTVLDARGRLLVAGSLGEFGKPDRDALLLRFDRAGHLDPAFDGDGIALVDFSGGAGDEGDALALTADGSILLGAEIHVPEGGSEFGVARVTATGALDRSFAEGGRFVLRQYDRHYEHFAPTAIAVLPDGRLGVAYEGWDAKGAAPGLLRLLADGSPDPAFSQYGPRLGFGDSSVSGAAVDGATGRMFFAGMALAGPADTFPPSVVALDPTATQPAWRASLGIVRDRESWASVLGLDARGRVVAAGTQRWDVPEPGGRLAGFDQRADMMVWRLSPKGKLDRCFGKRGVARVRFPGKLSTTAALTLDERGRIVVAGPSLYAYEHTPQRFELARLSGGSCRR